MSEWFASLTGAQIPVLVFILMTTNGFFSVPPSELTWGLAGYAVSQGNAAMGMTLLAGVTGNVFGTTILYAVARRWGEPAVYRLLKFNPTLRRDVLTAISIAFHRYGALIVAAGRCLPVIRSVISIPAGVAAMPLVRFLRYTLAGCSMWALLWGGLGYVLGSKIEQVIQDGKFPMLAVTVVVVLLGYKWIKGRTLSLLESANGTHPNSGGNDDITIKFNK